VNESAVFIVAGFAALSLLFRAFFRWLDVREHARIWRPQGTAHSTLKDQAAAPDRSRSA
jgi:hypothetical protein